MESEVTGRWSNNMVVDGAKELRIKMLIRMATNSKVIICSQIQMQLM